MAKATAAAKKTSAEAVADLMKDDDFRAAAVAMLQNSETPTSDPPTAACVEEDWDFRAYDPTEVAPHLVKHGIELDPASEYHWCELDSRVWPKRQAQGWKPVKGGAVSRGSTFLCTMPKTKVEKIRARNRRRTDDLMAAPMKRFEQEVSQFQGEHFHTFDGPKSLRDGLD